MDALFKRGQGAYGGRPFGCAQGKPMRRRRSRRSARHCLGGQKVERGSRSLAETERSEDALSVLAFALAFFEQALEFLVAVQAGEVGVLGHPGQIVVPGSDGLP